MQAFFIVLAIAGYLGFLVDWKEFGAVIREGGWAALVYFCLIGIAIAVAIAAPETATTPAVHH